MRTATAVIGANYGDEGKGLVVDALSGIGTVVVRFNGGAQAGHTVVTSEGLRHAFHHHGAGTFRGASTYLSEDFILNPLVFMREHKYLGYPKVMASPDARTTIPYDMMLNQWAEEDRGMKRHGSCGLGINETVERCEKFGGIAPISGMLRMIRHEWVPARAEALGIELTHNRCALLDSGLIIEQYLDAYVSMSNMIHWTQPEDVQGRIVFEGAQGLLLDEHAPGFPHVTRSRTGLYNVRKLCRQMGIEELDAIFVTRTYATRHGAGPFPTEDASLSFPDKTNVPNPWQQSLRFGKLDVPNLLDRIITELYNGSGVDINPMLAVTCVDQMDNPELRTACLFPMYESFGPTRETFCRRGIHATR